MKPLITAAFALSLLGGTSALADSQDGRHGDHNGPPNSSQSGSNDHGGHQGGGDHKDAGQPAGGHQGGAAHGAPSSAPAAHTGPVLVPVAPQLHPAPQSAQHPGGWNDIAHAMGASHGSAGPNSGQGGHGGGDRRGDQGQNGRDHNPGPGQGGHDQNWRDHNPGAGQGGHDQNWRDHDRDNRNWGNRDWRNNNWRDRDHDWRPPTNWNGRHGWLDQRRYPPVRWAQHRYHWRNYYAPQGWYARTWNYGDFLPWAWFGEDYYINDYYEFGLPPPPEGYVWVRVGDDALLIDEYTGQVVEVEHDLFY